METKISDGFKMDVGVMNYDAVKTRAEINGLTDSHYVQISKPIDSKVAELEEQLRLAKLEQKAVEPPKVTNFDENGRNRGGRPEFKFDDDVKFKVIFLFLAGTPKAKIARMLQSDHVSQWYVDKWTKDKSLIDAYKAKKGIK